MQKNSITLLETLISIIIISFVISRFSTYNLNESQTNAKLLNLKNTLIGNNLENCEKSNMKLTYTKESNSKLTFSNTGSIDININRCISETDDILLYKNSVNTPINEEFEFKIF